MTQQDVIELYQFLKKHGIQIWIDGRFCVEALLGCETRIHTDLDIAVKHGDVQVLRATLGEIGFSEIARADSAPWVFVLSDGKRQVDVHVFASDKNGHNIYGIEYPFGSLTGIGYLAETQVNCIAPEWMYRFKIAYPPAPKDIADVNLLAQKFGYSVPSTHQTAHHKN